MFLHFKIVFFHHPQANLILAFRRQHTKYNNHNIYDSAPRLFAVLINTWSACVSFYSNTD